LNLDVAPADIDPAQPLYGEGLGLDSIDILEIALVVSKRYGVQLRADGEENESIFSSLRQLADYITAHRTKKRSHPRRRRLRPRPPARFSPIPPGLRFAPASSSPPSPASHGALAQSAPLSAPPPRS